MSPELMRRQPTNPLRMGRRLAEGTPPVRRPPVKVFALNLADSAAIAVNEFHAMTSTGSIAQFLIIKSTYRVHTEYICTYIANWFATCYISLLFSNASSTWD